MFDAFLMKYKLQTWNSIFCFFFFIKTEWSWKLIFQNKKNECVFYFVALRKWQFHLNTIVSCFTKIRFIKIIYFQQNYSTIKMWFKVFPFFFSFFDQNFKSFFYIVCKLLDWLFVCVKCWNILKPVTHYYRQKGYWGGK